jgi:hypothetical protein
MRRTREKSHKHMQCRFSALLLNLTCKKHHPERIRCKKFIYPCRDSDLDLDLLILSKDLKSVSRPPPPVSLTMKDDVHGVFLVLYFSMSADNNCE